MLYHKNFILLHFSIIHLIYINFYIFSYKINIGKAILSSLSLSFYFYQKIRINFAKIPKNSEICEKIHFGEFFLIYSVRKHTK